MSIYTTYERPVLRDPKTGLLGQYAAYEGWTPREPRSVSSWWLVLGALLAVLAAIHAGL
jgi:hypothetical protein